MGGTEMTDPTPVRRGDLPGSGLLRSVADGTALDRKRIDKIVQAVRGGSFIPQAAEYAGCSPSSYRNWVKRGNKVAEHLMSHGLTYQTDERVVDTPEGRKRELEISIIALTNSPTIDPEHAELEHHDEMCLILHAEVGKAERDAELRMVAQWSKAAEDDWRAASTFLSKRYPTRWGERFAVTGADGGPVEVNVRPDLARDIASDPEARRLASELLARVTSRGDETTAITIDNDDDRLADLADIMDEDE